jgi:hypothetical protein
MAVAATGELRVVDQAALEHVDTFPALDAVARRSRP